MPPPRTSPPRPPAASFRIVEDRTAGAKCDEGYLKVRRLKLAAAYDDGTTSEPFPYDAVERWNQDAVAVLPHFVRAADGREGGVRHVVLRSSLRPPIALRRDPIVEGPVPFPAGAKQGALWEICAGLVEKDERTTDGLRACAVREVEEELGIRVGVDRLRPLGGTLFPASGVIGECVYLFEVEIDGATRADPAGDGSPLERGAHIIDVPLDEVIGWCDDGAIPDVKTEIAVRRLAAKAARDGRGA